MVVVVDVVDVEVVDVLVHQKFLSEIAGKQFHDRRAEVAKRFPQDVYGHLAQARVKSAAGDFAGAAAEAKQAQAISKSEAQKSALKPLIDRLEAKQDINK